MDILVDEFFNQHDVPRNFGIELIARFQLESELAPYIAIIGMIMSVDELRDMNAKLAANKEDIVALFKAEIEKKQLEIEVRAAQ